ncbi:hypothetical protein SGPA1_40810 [Streptomyces misionensis JCM 4497]
MDRAHRPLPAADRGPGPVARAAARAAGRGGGAERALGAVPAAHRDRVRHPRRRLAGPGAQAAGAARRGRRLRALQAADGRRRDDPADGDRRTRSARRCPRALHRAAGHGPGAAGVSVRRGRGVRRLRRVRYGRGDQQPARTAGPAPAAAAPGRGRGDAVLHRHRRARARPAGLADPRLRPGGGVRGAGRAGGDHLVGRRAAGLDAARPGAGTRGGGLTWYPGPERESPAERVTGWSAPRSSTSTEPSSTPIICTSSPGGRRSGRPVTTCPCTRCTGRSVSVRRT